jgi:transposase
LFSQFFESKAIEHLLGEGVQAHHLNDDRLGRALDRFYQYGVTNLFTTLALRAAKQFSVETERMHLDSTSMSVEGQYVQQQATASEAQGEAEPISTIALTYGYSRDRRPDLKQFLIDTICSGDGDMPLYLRVGDGNEVDGVGFRSVIDEYRQDWSFEGLMVADAALFTAENLKQMGSLQWISRVPLTLSQAQEVIAQVTPYADWKGIAKGYGLIELCTTYAGIAQRWVVVESDKRKDADLKQLQKRVEQQHNRQRRHLEQLCKESFACEADALKAIQQFEQTLHYCQLTAVSVVKTVHHGKRGRPKSDTVPDERFYPQATLVHNMEAIAAQQRIAGRFILATNVLDCDELSAVEVLQEYKKQQSSERGFRFLKDPLFFTSSVFLKSPRRIMALAMVMALCLLVYTLAQRKLRQALSDANTGIPNQLGRMTDTSTMRWVFQCFQAIHLVVVAGHRQVSNLSPQRLKILQFLGASCGRYYLLE